MGKVPLRKHVVCFNDGINVLAVDPYSNAHEHVLRSLRYLPMKL